MEAHAGGVVSAAAILGGFAMLLLQVLTEYVKAVPERKATKDALAKRDIDVLGDALARERRV